MAATTVGAPRLTSRTAPGAKPQRPPDGGSSAPSWPCLLASSDGHLREQIGSAAAEFGWTTVHSEGPRDALRHAVLHSFALAFVDIDGGADAGSLQAYAELLQALRGSPPGLVIVCERGGGEAQRELWAREQGAWLYLPEVDSQSDFNGLCREARAVAEKLRGPIAYA